MFAVDIDLDTKSYLARYEQLSLIHHVIQQQLSITQHISSSSEGDGRVDSNTKKSSKCTAAAAKDTEDVASRSEEAKWEEIAANDVEYFRIPLEIERLQMCQMIPDMQLAFGALYTWWQVWQDRPSTD